MWRFSSPQQGPIFAHHCMRGRIFAIEAECKAMATFLAGGAVAVSYLLLLMITMRPEYIPLLKRCFGM